jgi:hypothetical protein
MGQGGFITEADTLASANSPDEKESLPMRRFAALSFALLLAGCAGNESFNQWFGLGTDVARNMGYGDSAQAASGIKQALDLGSQRASTSLSVQDGYRAMGYPLSLPAGLQPVADTLRKAGLGSYVTRVESAMNRGAEQAAAEALPVFQQAIRNMTIQDALGIITGGDSAATDYFRGQTESMLRQRYQPIIKSNLESTGFYSQYKSMLDIYNSLPLTSRPNLDVEDHLMNQSLNALFGRMAAEEKMIREAPVARGSALIGAVFGQPSR